MFLILAIAIPAARSVFRFHPVHLDDLALSLAAVAVVAAAFGVMRRWLNRNVVVTPA